MNILVVCWANICRSPYAEGLLKQALPHLNIKSAGIEAVSGQKADPMMTELAASQSLDLTAHRSQPVHYEMASWADLILVMELAHQHKLDNLFPEFKGKIIRIGHFMGVDIDDPYKKNHEKYQNTTVAIRKSVVTWIDRLKN